MKDRLIGQFHRPVLLAAALLFMGPPANPQTTAQRLDEYFTELARTREFTGDVLVAERGKIIFEQSFGFADFSNRKRNTSGIAFPIASISKTLTATGILQLAEAGSLDVGDPVVKYLPAFPYPTMTIRHLLSHTSGLPPYNAYFDPSRALQPGKTFTNTDFLPALQADPKPLRYEPGDQGNYDNINYIVLALILEKVSGTSYVDYIARHILTPAGMHQTTFLPFARQLSDPGRPNFAFPHLYPHLYSETPVRALTIPYVVDYWRSYGFVGFGEYVSTTRDLLRYATALSTGHLLADSTLAAATRPVLLNDGKENAERFGLGWEIEKDTSLGTIIYHSGAAMGLSSVLLNNVSQRQVVVVFDNAHSNAHEIGTAALMILNGRTVSRPKRSLALALGRVLASRGPAAAGELLERLKADTATYVRNEDEINSLGYDFMGTSNPYHLPVAKRYDDALFVFKANSEMFPESWNVYDSYGEALLATGRREEATRMYQKSIALNPASQNGRNVLQKLLNGRE